MPAREDGMVVHQPGLAPAVRRRARPEPRRRSAKLVKAWKSATTVDPVAVAAYVPNDRDMSIGLALLGGAQGIADIEEASKLTTEQINDVLCDPVRMAWISTQVYSHFQQRAALVDSSLFTRAMAGDVQAIKLYYDRMALYTSGQKVTVEVSGGINVRALSDADLLRMVTEGSARLPAPAPPLLESKPTANIVDVDFTGASCV